MQTAHKCENIRDPAKGPKMFGVQELPHLFRYCSDIIPNCTKCIKEILKIEIEETEEEEMPIIITNPVDPTTPVDVAENTVDVAENTVDPTTPVDVADPVVSEQPKKPKFREVVRYRCLQCTEIEQPDPEEPKLDNPFVFSEITNVDVKGLEQTLVKKADRLYAKTDTGLRMTTCQCRINEYFDRDPKRRRCMACNNIENCRSCYQGSDMGIVCTNCYNGDSKNG
jgi:hypothetical protein